MRCMRKYTDISGLEILGDFRQNRPDRKIHWRFQEDKSWIQREDRRAPFRAIGEASDWF